MKWFCFNVRFLQIAHHCIFFGCEDYDNSFRSLFLDRIFSISHFDTPDLVMIASGVVNARHQNIDYWGLCNESWLLWPLDMTLLSILKHAVTLRICEWSENQSNSLTENKLRMKLGYCSHWNQLTHKQDGAFKINNSIGHQQHNQSLI